MSEWEFVAYQSLAAPEKSSFSMGPFGSKITQRDYKTSGIPLTRGINLAKGIFHDDDFVYISPEKADEVESANVRPGDLIFTHRGTIGQVSMIPRNPRFDRYVICSSQVKTRLDESKAMPEFYYYWFRSPEGQRSILKHSSTVGVPGIATPLTSIRNLRVPLPPLAIQEGISGFLGALDDKIAVNDRIAATAETLAIAHASEQRWRSRIPLSAVVDSIRISVAPARMMEPKVAHYSLPAYDAEREPDIVSPGDIKSSKLLIDRPAVLTSKLNPSNPRMWRVEPDSEMPSLASTEFLILSPSTGLTVAEIWACCMQPSVIREASSKVTGTSNSHQRIKLAEFLALNIVSPREMRESTREAINSLCKKADCSRKENRSLKKIRDALLPKLMSGEIRIRDAERVVEDAV